MNEWKEYRRKGTTTMRPFIVGENLSNVSVSKEDIPVEDGGMIARNKDNHDDQWYVSKGYHEKNNEVV